MKRSVNFLLYSLILFVGACSQSNLVGTTAQGKRSSKDVNVNNGNESDTTSKPSSDPASGTKTGDESASEPQIVTGSYLSCTPTVLPSVTLGESVIGCGVYSTTNDKKLELTSLELSVDIKSQCGVPITAKYDNAPSDSPFHKLVYLYRNQCQKVSYSAQVKNLSGVAIKEYTGKIITVSSVSEGLYLRKKHAENDLVNWCGSVTNTSLIASNKTSLFNLGAACGYEFLKCKSAPESFLKEFREEFESDEDEHKHDLYDTGVCRKLGKELKKPTLSQNCSCPS